MFQFLFKYPVPVFTKGRFVLLAGWPAWALAVLIVAAAGGLALLIRWKLRRATPELRSWRGWLIWGLQSALVALVLLLLWQPAILVSELNSQQNIIAVVVDDSRSMRIADSDGKTREAAAIAALEDGVLAGLQKRFQTRVYRLGQYAHTSRRAPTNRTGGTGHAHQRRPETTGHGDCGLAIRSRPLAQRRQPEYGRHRRLGDQSRCSAGTAEPAIAGSHSRLRQGGSRARC